jgi:2-polyprenyl-3-methyl-5-hydroxy-6-metoxy-1,4-benzoquinol methylase
MSTTTSFNGTKSRLNTIAKTYSSRKGLWGTSCQYQFTVCQEYFKGKRVLELGSADGETTKLLSKAFEKVVAVDGSHIALLRLRKHLRSSNVTLIEGLFEHVFIDETFDTIFMGHILEHVKDPVIILKKYANNLTPHGRIIITVPNALSLHRIAAVSMGILKNPHEVTKQDISIGHRRVYDRKLLHRDISRAGLHVFADDGYWLKLLSNAQITRQWTKEQIMVYMEMGRSFQDNCAELVAVCIK